MESVRGATRDAHRQTDLRLKKHVTHIPHGVYKYIKNISNIKESLVCVGTKKKVVKKLVILYWFTSTIVWFLF